VDADSLQHLQDSDLLLYHEASIDWQEEMGYRGREHDKEDTTPVSDRDRLAVIVKVLQDDLRALCAVLQSPAKAPTAKEEAKPYLPITAYNPH
jgi:hypothetical protein